jgi:type II secretory pathway pseudopilin PulG
MFALGNVQREAMEGARRITADLQKQEVERAEAIAKEEMLMGLQQADIAEQRVKGAQRAARQAQEQAGIARTRGFAGLASALGSISLDPFSKSERDEASANLAGLGGTAFNMGGMDLTGSEQIGGMDMSAPQGLSDFSQYSFGGLGGAPKLGSGFTL